MKWIKTRLIMLTLAVSGLTWTLPVKAEVNQSVTASGNNVGFVINSTGNDLTFAGAPAHQFPAGSGNQITTARWTFALNCVRDLDGDGSIEDTTNTQSNGAWMRGYTATPEARDLLEAAYKTGIEMKLGASTVGLNQVWSSLDNDDLATWPVQFREGRSASGSPILHGAQTIATFSSDVWIPGELGPGASLENQFYFLNFSISSNMVFGHTRIQNMTEYLKWNRDIASMVAGTPNGQTWRQWELMYVVNSMTIGSGGSSDVGWAYHPSLKVPVQLDIDGTDEGFTGGFTPFVAFKLLTPPSWQGKTMDLTNIEVRLAGASTYGFTNGPNLLATGRPSGEVWRFGLGDGGNVFNGQINPFTGQPAQGWPGDLRGTQYENRWVFGHNGPIAYTFYGVLDDFAPRDTASMDYVIMFVQPANPPAVLPADQIANIGDQAFQDQLVPVTEYTNAAQTILSSGYSLPVPPAAPGLTIIPGDRQVTLTWSDVNLSQSDPYYAFLHEHPELDPEGNYVEKDFDGYRLYRNYSGPNDAHAEKIYECSLSAGDLMFSYVDKIDNDERRRMANGLRVWYSLVPFDKNFDPISGEEFSLPPADGSKIWYGSPQNGLYTVTPRSDASNYKPANALPAVYTPADGTVGAATTYVHAGDGSKKLLDAPVLLNPSLELAFTAINNERITSPITFELTCTAADASTVSGFCDGMVMAGHRTLTLTTNGEVNSTVDIYAGAGNEQKFYFNSPVDASGVNYFLEAKFTNMNKSGNIGDPLYHNLADGGFLAAHPNMEIGLWTTRECDPTWYAGSAPSNIGLTKTGRFSVTWKSAGDGFLTVEVKDATRNNETVDFIQFVDEEGWGFQTVEGFGDNFSPGAGAGNYNNEAFVDHIPKEERQYKMLDKIPVDQAEEFGFWIDGLCWIVRPKDGGAMDMPSAGTIWTVDVAFGDWNDDKTVFTQYGDLPRLGDKWTVEVRPSTLNAEDADLSRINVVPNPYICSSYLDIGPASRRIEFVNLPSTCTIRIYSLGGVLVNVLNHIGANRNGWGNYTDWDQLDTSSQPKQYQGYDNHGGTEPWNLRNRFGQMVASGLYFYHVSDSRGKTCTGKFYIVN
jgi:hypothetical protein